MPTKTKTSVPLRDRILDQIPDYRSALLRADALRSLTLRGLDLGNTGTIDTAYYAKISDAVTNGADNLDDLRDQYTADITGMQARSQFHALVVRIMQQSRADAETALGDNTDVALDYLRSELDTLMVDVRNNRTLIDNHPATAEAALSAGPQAAQDWATVTTLLGRYDEIRREHLAWVRRQSGDMSNAAFATIGQTARFLEADPTWLYRRATTPAPSYGWDPAVTTITAWLDGTRMDGTRMTVDPAEAQRDGIWPNTIRPTQWLLTVADNNPWVPDGPTITACQNTADELLRNTTNTGASWFLRSIATLTEHGAITDLQLTDA